MSIYEKKAGGLKKIAGYLVQRWNDAIFQTSHSYSADGNTEYYDIDPAASDYIAGLTNYTEFSLYIAEPNTTENVFIRFNGRTMRVVADSEALTIGQLTGRRLFYTLDGDTTNDIFLSVTGAGGGGEEPTTLASDKITFDGTDIGLMIDDGEGGLRPVENAKEAIEALDNNINLLEAHDIISDDESIVITNDTTANTTDLSTKSSIIPHDTTTNWLGTGSVGTQLDKIALALGNPTDFETTAKTATGAVNELKEYVEGDLIQSDDESITLTKSNHEVDLSVNIANVAYTNTNVAGITTAKAMLDWLNTHKYSLAYVDTNQDRTIDQATGFEAYNGPDGSWEWVPMAKGLTTTDIDDNKANMTPGSISKTDADGKWGMVAVYHDGEEASILTQDDGTAINLWVRAIMTNRSAVDNGVRLLVLSNDKVYVKVGNNNNVTSRQEIGISSRSAGNEYLFIEPYSPYHNQVMVLPKTEFVKSFLFDQAAGTYTVQEVGHGDIGTKVNFLKITKTEQNTNLVNIITTVATGVVVQNDGTNVTVHCTLNVIQNVTHEDGGERYNTLILNDDRDGISIFGQITSEPATTTTIVTEGLMINPEGGIAGLVGVLANGNGVYLGTHGDKAYYTGLDLQFIDNNEVVNRGGLKTVTGKREDLTTTNKTDLVAAINEVNELATSAVILRGWAEYLFLTATDETAATPNDLDFAFRYDLLTWRYYSTATTSWVPLPNGWAKVNHIVRTAAERDALTAQIGETCGVLEDESVWVYDGAAWQASSITGYITGDQFLMRMFYGEFQGVTYTGMPTAEVTLTGAGWTYNVFTQVDFDDLKDLDWS